MCSRAGLFLGLVALSGHAFSGAAAAAEQFRRLEGVVNLNAASPEQLRLLSGIGPAKIRNILAYRRAHPFRTVDELVRIKGIGRKMVRRLRMHLAVDGPTTAQIVIRPMTEDAQALVGPPLPATRPRGFDSRATAPAAPAAGKAQALRAASSAVRGAARTSPGAARFPLATANHCSPPP